MLTSTTKKIITPASPISIIRQTQTDYGSTTATATRSSASFSNIKRISKDNSGNGNGDGGGVSHKDFQQQIEVGSRFSAHTGRVNSGHSTVFKKPVTLYENLGETPKSQSPSISASSRLPSFVSLSGSSGRCVIHPMDHNSKSAVKNQASRIKILEYYLNVLNHVCIGFVTIYMSWLCLHLGLAGTALHAWLVTVGFSFLMAEGIVSHYSGNVLTQSFHRDTKTRIHWIFQALGGGLGMIGTLTKMIQKGFLIQSTHGKLGLAAFILCFISMTSGLSALYSMRLKHLLTPLMNKTLHNYIGYATLVIALLAQFYGYSTGFFIRKTEHDFRNLMRALTIITIILCSIGPLKTLLKRTQMVVSHYMH